MDPVVFLAKVSLHRVLAFDILHCLVEDLLGEVDVKALSGSHHFTGLLLLGHIMDRGSGIQISLFAIMLVKTLACQLRTRGIIATHKTSVGVFRTLER